MEKARAARRRVVVALVMVGLLVGLQPARAQAQTAASALPRVVSVDASGYPDVVVDVVVPATTSDLTAGAFQLSDGRVTSATRLGSDALDVVVILDDRRSTGSTAFADVKAVSADLIGNLAKGTHVAVSSVTGLGGLPTDDLDGAAVFISDLTAAAAPAAETPAAALVRIGGLLKPGAGRRTHVVLVAGDAAALTPTQGAALQALLAKVGAELSVITVAPRLDPSIVEAVTAGGVAVAADGTDVGGLAATATAALTSRYRLQAIADATGAHTLTVQLPGGSTTSAELTVDQPGSGPTSSASVTTAGSGTTTASNPAVPTSAVATGASGSPAASTSTSIVTSSTSVLGTGDSSTNATTRGRSHARLIALLATAGVLEGIVVALFAFRRFGGRQPRSTWIEFDTLRVSAQRDDAWRGARALRLDPNERAVLLTMVRKPGHIFSREDIAALAWPERTDVSPRLVSTMMDHLQRTVDGFDDTPLVHTVRGAGYVLSDPTDTDDSIASAIRPRLPRYAPPPNRPASRR